MSPECERVQLAMLDGASTGEHARTCDDCRSFSATERRLAPPPDLVARTLARLGPELLVRAANRRQIYWGLTLAGALSLPFIVALNGAIMWMLHATLERLATPELAAAGTVVAGVSLLLALSLAYGSLPLLASWGLQLRERTT